MATPYYQDESCAIYHGDCREVLPALSERPDLVLTDPPYMVSKVGRHDADARDVKGMDDPFWILPAVQQTYRIMAPDSFCVSFYGWRQADHFLFAWRAAGLKPVGHLVWVKRQWGLGSYVRSKHESAYLLTKGSPRPAKVVADVFDWRREADKKHPTQKPVAALMPVIQAIRPRLILDPFLGSGSTLLAARSMGCPAIGIEIEERYCQIAAERLGQEVLDLGAPA